MLRSEPAVNPLDISQGLRFDGIHLAHPQPSLPYRGRPRLDLFIWEKPGGGVKQYIVIVSHRPCFAEGKEKECYMTYEK